jgi:hypothetical protein
MNNDDRNVDIEELHDAIHEAAVAVEEMAQDNGVIPAVAEEAPAGLPGVHLTRDGRLSMSMAERGRYGERGRNGIVRPRLVSKCTRPQNVEIY